MDRREALKHVAVILGGTVISSQAFLSGCRSGTKAGKINELFTQSNIRFMDEIAETIIPATDTLGAKAAKVGSFMAMMVPDCYDEKTKESFLKGLGEMQRNFEAEFGHSFMNGQVEERQRFLTALDKEIEPYYAAKKEEDPDHYFRVMKELILLGYFTSEIGSTQALRYVQTPGRYDACIPYKEGEKAWA